MFDFLKTKTGLQFAIASTALICLILFLSTINYRSIKRINTLFNRTLSRVEHKEELSKLILQLSSVKQNLKYTLTLSEKPLIAPLITELAVIENKIKKTKTNSHSDIQNTNELLGLIVDIKAALKEMKKEQSFQFNVTIKNIYALFESAIATLESDIIKQQKVIKNNLLLRNKIYYNKTISMVLALFIITLISLAAIITSLRKMSYFKRLIVSSINQVANGKSSLNLPLILSEIARSIDVVDTSLQKALDVAENERMENQANKAILAQLQQLKDNNVETLKQEEASNEQDEETQEAPQEETPAITEPLPTMKALIIEDNATSMRLVQTLLYNVNSMVDQAANGKDALKLISKETYDIIFLDINLPDINGYNISKIIRQKLKNKTPIVAISSLNDPDNIKKAMTSGMNDFLHKPVNMRSLRSKLEKFLPKKSILWS